MATAHGSFWASEETSANGAYTWVSNNNTVGSESKSNYVGQFFCVGD